MNGNAQVLKTNVVLFPNKTEPEMTVDSEKLDINVRAESLTLKVDVRKRFARLKKAMRKRSISIL